MNSRNFGESSTEVNENENSRKRYVNCSSVNMIGVAENVKVYMTQNSEKLIKLNLKIPVDLNNPTQGPYNWFYVSCFNLDKSVKIGDWLYVMNGRLGKYKSVKEGQVRYLPQITCNENSLINLTDLVKNEVPISRGEDINDILDEIKSKFLDEETDGGQSQD